jgi:sarcosine oxidase subunit alpha
MNLRVTQGTRRGEPCNFFFQGTQMQAYQGETIAAALIAEGRRQFRVDSLQQARGPYCNMGTCFECLVQVRARIDVTAGNLGEWRLTRACLTRVSEGLEVRSIESPSGASFSSGDRPEHL